MVMVLNCTVWLDDGVVMVLNCTVWLDDGVVMVWNCTVWLGSSHVLLLISSTARRTAPSSGESGDGNITPARNKKSKS